MSNVGYCRLLVASWIGCISLTGMVQAASLQFVVLCDTLDPSIGTVQDLAQADAWAQTLASDTGLALHLQSLSGNVLTPAGARDLIRSLSPGSEDVIYFVYSGHGANPGDSQWPQFRFVTETSDPPVTFDEVVSALKAKPHRLLIVLSDCCNVAMNSSPPPAALLAPSGPSDQALKNVQHLFLDFQGTVLAAAASVGQYSLGDSSEGGLFLNTFMDDLNSLADRPSDLTWDEVLSATAADVTQQARIDIAVGHLGDIQAEQPHYTIDGSMRTTGQSAPCGATGIGPLLATAIGFLALMTGRRTWLPPR